MKKGLLMLVTTPIWLAGACSEEPPSDPPDLSTSPVTADTADKEVTALARNNSFHMEDLGKVEVLKTGTGQQETVGPLHMNIGRVSVIKVTPDEDIRKEYLDASRPSMTAVVVDMISMNKGEVAVSVTPEEMTITEADEQISPDERWSTWPGGDISVGETMGGAIWYPVEEVPTKLTYTVRLGIDAEREEALPKEQSYVFDLQEAEPGDVTPETLGGAWRQANVQRPE